MAGIKKTILVIEDEAKLVAAIKDALKRKDFIVYHAASMVKARGVIEGESKIDAIWLDHYLIGQENGLDFVAWLKKYEQRKNLPIFLVTNTASPEKIHNYLSLGITKFYTKANVRLAHIINDIISYLE